MEKRSRTYDLHSIKAAFRTVSTLRMTRTARQGTVRLGLTLDDVVELIQSLTPHHFYKSMTTYANSQIWQDVYHVPWQDTTLYLKFTADAEGHIIISLKEK